MATFRKTVLAPIALISASLMLAACSSDTGAGNGGSDGVVKLTFANSFTDDHPHSRCGATMIADKLNEMQVGLQVDVFTNSTLGSDVDRFSSLMAGDIDLDIQGPSAISSTYPTVGVMDTAYAFEGADHIFEFYDSGAADQLKADLLEATGTRALEPYFFGMRNFSANKPIRTPQDLEGERMRFPDTPAYLANAEALGAEAVAVAFEELFLALQQGIVDGQENPIPTVASMSLDEVQSHVSLSEHQTGSQLILINEETWQSLSEEQQGAIADTVTEVREINRECIDEMQQEIVDEWEETGTVEVVEDVDREAFAKKAEAYFMKKYTGAELELFTAIREAAPSN